MSQLNPYISFRGNAREALEFYRSVFGGELTVSTFREFGMPGVPDEELDNVMHGQLVGERGHWLMAADTPSTMPQDSGSTITISLSGDDEDELRGYWDGLADGASLTMPLEKAPWGDTFGQLTDKFGVAWMVNIAGQAQES